MSYSEYKALGGKCPENLFLRFSREASAFLANLATFYDFCGDVELATVLLIDYYYQQDDGGNVVSVSVGSYSETRKTDTSVSTEMLKIKEILQLRRKKVLCYD